MRKHFIQALRPSTLRCGNWAASLFLLLAGVFTALPAAADAVDEITSGESYRIMNGGTTGYGLYDPGTGTVPTAEAYSAGDDAFFWIVTETGTANAYTIQNASTGRYIVPVSSTGGAAALSSTATTCYISSNANQDGYFNILASASSSISLNLSGSDGSVIGWAANNGGTSLSNSEWTFETVDAYEEAIGENNGLVRLISGRSTSRVAYDNGDNGVYVHSRVTSSTDWTEIWIIESSSDGGYTLRNASSGNYINAPSANYTAHPLSSSAETFYICDATDVSSLSGYSYISTSSSFSDQTCLHDEGNTNRAVKWSTGQAGSCWKIEAVEEDELTAADVKEHFAEIIGTTSPETGKYYRILSKDYEDRYLQESYSDHQLPCLGYDDDAYNQVWELTSANGTRFSIKNVSTGRYIQNLSSSSAYYSTGTTARYFNIASTGTSVYEDLFTIEDATRTGYGLHCASSQSYMAVQWNISASASVWCFEEVSLTDEELVEATAQYEAYQEMNDAETIQAALDVVFADKACTELNETYAAMDATALRAALAETALPEALQEVAVKVGTNSWDAWEKEFRVAEYGAYSRPAYWSNKLNTNPYGRINNPTGIVADANEYTYIFVEGDIPSGATLELEAHTGYTDHWGQQSLTLTEGYNMLCLNNDASYLFVLYECADGALIADQPNIKIHIEGGHVNGWFDCRTRTDEDWVQMQSDSLFTEEIIDLVGDFVQLRVQSEGLRESNPTAIHPIMGLFDWFVERELDLMGLTAAPDSLIALYPDEAEEVYEDLYPKYFNNHMLVSSPSGGDMYATSYGVVLGSDYMSSTYCYDEMKALNGCIWAPGHEIGHMNQGAINLAGCTEISNNLFSNALIQLGGTCTTRGWSVKYMQEKMAAGEHCWTSCIDYWLATRMYFCLYLYYHTMGHNQLFYQKLYKSLREDPFNHPTSTTTYGTGDYLKFAMKACDAAGEDLTEYFDYWGFFKPVSQVTVADYSTWTITTTQAQINSTKTYMSQYPKANGSIMFIDDHVVASRTYEYDGFEVSNTGYTWGQYTDFDGSVSNPTNFYYTINSSGRVTVPVAAKGAAGIKIYDADSTLIYVSQSRAFTIPSNLLDEVAYMIVGMPDGTEIPLYKATDEGVYKMNIYQGNSTAIVRYTNGDDSALLTEERDGLNAVVVLEAEDAPKILTQRDNIVDASGTAYSLVLTDGADFYAPSDFTATTAVYNRSGMGGHTTACVPFALTLDDLPNGCAIEPLDSVIANGDDYTLVFDNTATSVEAGVPCLVYSPWETPAWSIKKSGVNIRVTPVDVEMEGVTLKGTYVAKAADGLRFYVNADKLFTDTGDTLAAFRAYVDGSALASAATVSVSFTDPNATAINAAQVDADVAYNALEAAVVYDLSGRRVNVVRKGGVYIVNGKKVVVK